MSSKVKYKITEFISSCVQTLCLLRKIPFESDVIPHRRGGYERAWPVNIGNVL